MGASTNWSEGSWETSRLDKLVLPINKNLKRVKSFKLESCVKGLPFNIEYDQIFRIKRVSLREDELPFEINPNENRQSFDEFVEFLNS